KADATERAYQKQPTIFQKKKRVLAADGGKESKEKLPRYHKSVGLGFKIPREAIDGTFIDKKRPFTGNVSIRGRILSGQTIVIRRDYLQYIQKYNCFEKRHKNLSVADLSPRRPQGDKGGWCQEAIPEVLRPPAEMSPCNKLFEYELCFVLSYSLNCTANIL
uniref:Small ribosomal subunit protein uS17 n=1 Tax=Hippocampus comes TaxID=109280 RepID=A0A3Q2XJV5_HIPCM